MRLTGSRPGMLSDTMRRKCEKLEETSIWKNGPLAPAGTAGRRVAAGWRESPRGLPGSPAFRDFGCLGAIHGLPDSARGEAASERGSTADRMVAAVERVRCMEGHDEVIGRLSHIRLGKSGTRTLASPRRR